MKTWYAPRISQPNEWVKFDHQDLGMHDGICISVYKIPGHTVTTRFQFHLHHGNRMMFEARMLEPFDLNLNKLAESPMV